MVAKLIRTMPFYRAALSTVLLLLLFLSRGELRFLAPAAAVAVLGISAGLFFLKSTKRLTLPFLLLSLLLIFCYDSYAVFIRYVWLLPIALGGLAVYIVRQRPRFTRGKSFYPLVAVAAATLLGGIGRITAGEYFRPIALFYTLSVGPLLVGVYLLMRALLDVRRDGDDFLDDLATLAMVAAAIVFFYRIGTFVQIARGEPLPHSPQWSNNIATLLMLSLPALFVKARERYPCLFAGLFCGLAAMLSGSNAALALVILEMLFCLFWLLLTDDRPLARLWNKSMLAFLVALTAATVYYLCSRAPGIEMTQSLSGRRALLLRGFEDFLKNPLFGSGLGFLGNADLYDGKVGTINWYHLFLSQVVGGLGLVGVLAWGYQLLVRAALSLRVVRERCFGFSLCYLGLFLMSQLNPGEFCPVPYAFLAVVFFVFVEQSAERPADKVAPPPEEEKEKEDAAGVATDREQGA